MIRMHCVHVCVCSLVTVDVGHDRRLCLCVGHQPVDHSGRNSVEFCLRVLATEVHQVIQGVEKN